ncbi:MAG: hypothetical protein BWY75_03273 [bacterium ADurb.Bin425]|nr:MAG: hypothetical protein BWY75_03273 [bacterium ADurb.Bin425]
MQAVFAGAVLTVKVLKPEFGKSAIFEIFCETEGSFIELIGRQELNHRVDQALHVFFVGDGLQVKAQLQFFEVVQARDRQSEEPSFQLFRLS